MMKFLTLPFLPAYDIERLARAFAEADGLNPNAFVQYQGTTDLYAFFSTQSVPLWQTYLPKVREFLQMKMVYDHVFPAVISPHMTQNMPVGEIPLPHTLPDMNPAQVEVFKNQALEEAGDPAMPKISIDTIRQLVKNHGIKQYMLRQCGICYEPLFYAIDGEHVSYQPNCGCTRDWRPPEQRSYADLVQNFNIQEKPDIRRRMMEKFINSGEKQEQKQIV